MKPAILFLFLLAIVPNAGAQDSNYRQNLQKMQDRCSQLEMEANDYRKPDLRLTPEKERELFCLQGQLRREDPVGALRDEIHADIRVLDALPTKTAADTALIETLKNFLADVSGAADLATTRAQAEEHATAMRQFVTRRDVAGLKAWTEAHPAR